MHTRSWGPIPGRAYLGTTLGQGLILRMQPASLHAGLPVCTWFCQTGSGTKCLSAKPDASFFHAKGPDMTPQMLLHQEKLRKLPRTHASACGMPKMPETEQNWAQTRCTMIRGASCLKMLMQKWLSHALVPIQRVSCNTAVRASSPPYGIALLG